MFTNQDLEDENNLIVILAGKAAKLEEDSSLDQSEISDELWEVIPSEFEDNDEMIGIVEELSDIICAELEEIVEEEEEEE